ncbi:Glycerophosphocholine acyltransferase 1 [Sesamum angolense]|uniref:Glycerophosphocholine acyltransferase 1 n=1 Tax=Sesamum angolense TaxID=2727404 RepID=A0AAE1WEK5_9LAMI|nr:Glycerophosphocholine acyltransferase 1 [Sesamum angolense]
MASNDETLEMEDSNGEFKLRLKDPSKKVAQTKEMLSKQAVQTKEMLSKQAIKIAKQAEEHERFINKVTHLLGVLGFGGFCFILGARPQDVRYLYCLFYVIFVPLRWIYYRYKKWHYYLLDFCYYANTIFLIMLLCFPKNEKLFMVCFSFAEGPLAWALIVWRCSLVFNSMDKIVSVFIHLLPGLVFFTIRWWDPVFFEAMHPEGTARRASWPYVESKSYLWTWLFFVPLAAYCVWQLLYFLIVDVLRRQRLLRDPEVMTSYRLCRATTALTVPIFLSYELHVTFQVLKVSASVWNGGNFLLEVMPRQVILKEKKKTEMQPIEPQLDQLPQENSMEMSHSSEVIESQ